MKPVMGYGIQGQGQNRWGAIACFHFSFVEVTMPGAEAPTHLALDVGSSKVSNDEEAFKTGTLRFVDSSVVNREG